MRSFVFALLAVILASVASPAEAAMITKLLPSDINGLDTNTASFSDGNVTLTPFIGGVQDTFNGNGARLGIDSGTNANAFNDPDVDPINGNEETLTYDFAANVGLAQMEYDFSRADGPDAADGVVFTGFLSDPNVTFSVVDPNLFAVYDGGAGSVRLNIPGVLFGGTLVAVNFNPVASLGQTLQMSVTDTTQAGAQLAIRSISYDVIPEPTALALLALAAGSFACRGRN